MIQLAEVKQEELAADLGSGDGRILVALAKAGAIAHGYELDEKLNQKASNDITKEKLTANIVLHQSDFWHEDLSQFSLITCYPMPDIMEPLEKKLYRELKPGSRILLNYYPFPSLIASKTKDNIYLYSI